MSKKLSNYDVKYSHYERDPDDTYSSFPPTKPSGYTEPKLEGHSPFLKFANTRMVKDPVHEIYNEDTAIKRLKDSLQEEKGIQPYLNDEFKDGRIPYEAYQHFTPKVEPPKPVEVKETSKEDLEKAEALGYLKALRFVQNYLHTKELGDDEFVWLNQQIREHCKT